jgi:Flp pilus assembly protein TadG
MGAGALAVDYARGLYVREQMQSAADAAALAGKSDLSLSKAEAEAKAEQYFRTNTASLSTADKPELDIQATDDAVIVKARAKMDTSLGAVLGTKYQWVEVTSQAISSTDDLELALVLDNTGSMADHMDELRTGANALVDTLFESTGSNSKMKVAVVPYVGAVNIGNHPSHKNWMDQNGDARHHAEALEWRYFGYEPGCTYTGGGGGTVDPGSGTTGSLWDHLPSFATLIQMLNPMGEAKAASAGDVPSPYMFAPDCWIAAPDKINLFDYFDNMSNTEWKGCVEARAEPYDVTDEPPSNATPDTLFVPWFWPDEIDVAAQEAQFWSYRSANDYIPDRLDLRDTTFPKFTDPWLGWGFGNVIKYAGATATVDEVGPDTSGPNKSCPDPIMPLTNDHEDITDKIDSLTHWNGSGTNIAEGLAWGWRVLSPGKPFNEGKPYGKAKKVIVLMTDGVNNVDPAPEFSMLSEFSAYGYLQQWGWNRIPDKTYAGFKTYTDGRLAQLCANAKAEGISVYTVAFGITDETTLDILESCATAPPYAYTASTASDLVQAFKEVASALSQLRLSK